MTEWGIGWQCPKCMKYQQKVLRFNNPEQITQRNLLTKARKNYFVCVGCNHKTRFARTRWKKFGDPQQLKTTISALNKINLVVGTKVYIKP